METGLNDTDEQLLCVVRQFENAEEVTRPAREKSEKCQDYFDDKQLTADETKALEDRGQPAVVFNEIKPKVKTMLGLEKQTRKDPKAFPRNPDDEDASRAATDSIRYVCEDSRWDDKRSMAAKNLAIQGTCAVKVGLKKAKDGADPEIRHIAWDRFYFDPHSSADDFEDAAFMGEVIWMDLADATAKHPDAKDALEATWHSSRYTETYDDKPKFNLWADYKRKRVRICEHYYREQGQWMFCIVTRGGFVVKPQVSPYVDADGEPECPLKAISLYVDRDNNRYGEVQAMLSPQDEINKRRSKALHHVSTRQIRVSPNVQRDANDVRKELARPDGVWIGEQGDVEIFDTNDMAAGNLNLMQDAREHIHRTGANSALAGKDTNSQSGKAIALQQMGGMTEAADYLDCIRRLSLAVYRSVWGRVRQAWTAEKWIRVTDNENNVRFVGLNKPITALQQIAKQMGVTKETLDQADPQMVAQLQQMAQDPRSQQVVGMENAVADLDVDIIVDEGIDTPTIAAEQFEQIAQMMGSAPPQIQPMLWKVLLKSSALRDKEQIEEAMNQPPSPEQQAAVELEMAQAKADVENKQADTMLKIAQAQAMNPQAEMEMEREKAAGQMQLDREKAGAQIELEREKAAAQLDLAAQKQGSDMMLGERKQVFGEEMARRQAQAKANEPRKAA